MLHPIKPVACLAEMNRLLGFQRGVLELGIALATGSALDQATFKQVLNDDAGGWFWNVYQRNQNWHTFLDALVTALASDFSAHRQVILAFDNDIKFQNHLNDPMYLFEFPALPEAFKSAIKDLFELFYKYSYSTGYPEAIHGKQGFILTRSSFIKSYEEAASNGLLYVCPVCDQEISDEDIDSETGSCELDHFFAKSTYPFLSMHPFNLIPTCHYCNSNVKGAVDPLADGIHIPASSGTFLNTYHPHKGRSIRDLGKILIDRSDDPKIECQTKIDDGSGVSEHRIASAQRVYQLSSRWKSRLNKRPGIVPKVIHWICQDAKKRRAENILTLAGMLEDLESICTKHVVARDGHHVLRDAYIQFALNDVEEQKYLFREYSNSA
jgi:hypothetical protein